ncbi:MAG: hypothetical protein OXB84_06970, partial [Halobacteriovoraceae bacterium]|nr:hypothetical protein [Halobacteriovoraceae bacterium]
MKTLLFLLTFFFNAQIVVGQTSGKAIPGMKKIKQDIEELRTLRPEDFMRQIEGYRNEVGRFIEHKKRVCDGEFSKKVLGEASTDEPKKKLTKEEKEACVAELVG